MSYTNHKNFIWQTEGRIGRRYFILNIFLITVLVSGLRVLFPYSEKYLETADSVSARCQAFLVALVLGLCWGFCIWASIANVFKRVTDIFGRKRILISLAGTAIPIIQVGFFIYLLLTPGVKGPALTDTSSDGALD